MKNTYNPHASVPKDIADMAMKLKQYMAENYIESIYGLGDIYAARWQTRQELGLEQSQE